MTAPFNFPVVRSWLVPGTLTGGGGGSGVALSPPTIQIAYGNGGVSPINELQQADAIGTLTPVAGTRYYFPMLRTSAINVNVVGVYDGATITAGSLVNAAIYNWGSAGLPGTLLGNLTSGSPITQNGANTAASVGNPTTPVYVPAGWFWLMLQFNSTSQAYTGTLTGPTGAGMSGPRDITMLSLAATFGDPPATGDTTGLTAIPRSSGYPPLILFK